MDTKRVHLILQFALAVAAQNDEWTQRKLGPIHLIKYLYLADLRYAKLHKGKTFTGIPWRFHKFGPWNEEAFLELEPALNSIQAHKDKIESKYEDDYIRWYNSNPELVDQLMKELDLHIALEVKDSVLKFGADTEDLLHYVYQTKPMLNAAPGEPLDFSNALEESQPVEDEPDISQPLSEGQKKRKEKKIKAIKEEIKKRSQKKKEMRKKRQEETNSQPSPRYDEVYFKGVEWLDSLAREDIQEEEFTVSISPEIWRSKARYDPDLS